MFVNCDVLKKILRFVVKEAAAGRADVLTRLTIANEVFGNHNDNALGPAFGRIRQKLREYYGGEGRSEPLRIQIPDGGCIPEFSWAFPSSRSPHQTIEDDLQENAAERAVIESAGQILQVWNVPPRNPFFTARDTYLASVRESLIQRSAAGISQPLAITGIGGVGKTQTVIEYAYRYRQHYSAGIWIGADSQDSLLSGFVSVANLLDFPDMQEKEAVLIAGAVCRWLQVHTDWLLIFDNVDDLNVVRQYLPDGNGHCLITTRLHATGGTAEGLDLPRLSLREGALFLLRRAKALASMAPLEAASGGDREAAEQLTTEVGGLPLALDQAGAFIEETPSTLAEYLSLYRTEGAALRALHGQFSRDHAPVTITFTLAFESLNKKNAAAADLIRASAFLAPDAIPEELFVDGGTDLGGSLAQIATKPLAFAEALREAARFTLIRRNPANKTLDIHRLVQDVIKDGMGDDERQSWTRRVVHAMATIFPLPDFHSWNECERLVSHVNSIFPTIQQYKLNDVAASHILSNCGTYLCQRARYREAEQFLTVGLAISEKTLGPEHRDTATTINALGQLRSRIGSYRDAARLYDQALTIREMTLGPEHPDTATTMNNMADVLIDEFKYVPRSSSTAGFEHEALSKAGLLYERALTIREKVLGPEHPDTGNSLTSLAALYCIQKRFTEADELYKRSLAISEQTLGPEHPDTARVLHGLALLYYRQGFNGKAESLLQRTISITEKTLGFDHPDLAAALESYIALLRDTGRDLQAAHLTERAKTVRAKLINLHGTETLKGISELIDRSGLDDAIKAVLKEDLRCWGLTDRIREIIKAYCIKNLRDLDRAIAVEKIRLSIVEANQVMAQIGEKTCTQLQSHYNDAIQVHRAMLDSGVFSRANTSADLIEIEVSLEKIRTYIQDHSTE